MGAIHFESLLWYEFKVQSYSNISQCYPGMNKNNDNSVHLIGAEEELTQIEHSFALQKKSVHF